jgi:glycosyltransferase involved in cell wall biosynthesis
MEDITHQTIFDQCELIMINAHSPGNEELVIKRYIKRYKNIVYVRLDSDPGLYGVWNMAIKMAKGSYITNANLDDRLKNDCYKVHLKLLEKHPECDLVYSDFYMTLVPNETFECCTNPTSRPLPQFSKRNMRFCLPNNHPMWRKSMHEKYGFFDETYKYAGDYEMWLRAVSRGSRFIKASGVYGLYYRNPLGLSSNANNVLISEEEAKINAAYRYVYS